MLIALQFKMSVSNRQCKQAMVEEEKREKETQRAVWSINK